MELAVVVFLIYLVGGVVSLRTRGWWIPGALAVAGAVVLFATIPSTEGDVGGMAAMAAGVVTLAGIAMLALGVIFLVAGAVVRDRALKAAAPPPPAPLPVAIAR